MANEKLLVKDLRDRQSVRSIFLVAKKSLPVGKTGKPYLALTLSDKSGEVEARLWDDAEEHAARFAAGDFVQIQAEASLYNGRLQLKLDTLERLAPDGVRPEDFLPESRFDAAALFAQVRGLVVQVKNPHIRALLLGFLDDPEIGPAFQRAPAAKGVHHPFLGGLCEHTLSVLQLGWRVCDHYPQLDRDLITAGCLLHDIGKTRELTYERGFDYSDEGRLVGHLVMTCQWIHERVQAIPDFPRELEWHLVHLVAAHHGKLEFGSPKVPHTLEAMVVHALDELDSRVNSFGLLFDKARGDSAWTEYQRLYERSLFKGPSWDGQVLAHDERRLAEPSVYRARADQLAAETSLASARSAGVPEGAGKPRGDDAPAPFRPRAANPRREPAAHRAAEERPPPPFPDLFGGR
ncbi:MAG: HD domain-containing protein [Myxococcales bacterium]